MFMCSITEVISLQQNHVNVINSITLPYSLSDPECLHIILFQSQQTSRLTTTNMYRIAASAEVLKTTRYLPACACQTNRRCSHSYANAVKE